MRHKPRIRAYIYMLASIKSFAISFAVAIVIFGVAGYFVNPLILGVVDGFIAPGKTEVTTSVETDNEPETTEPAETLPPDDILPDVTGSSFTLLLIGSDYQPDVFSDYRCNTLSVDVSVLAENQRHYKAEVIVLIRFSVETGTCMITAIPSNLSVTVSGAEMQLSSVLEKKNVTYFTKTVESLVGIPIDYYVCSQIGLFIDIIDGLGGIKYDVPCDMYYVNEEERIVLDGASRDPIPLTDALGNPMLDELGEPIMIPAGKAFTIDLKKGIQTLTGEKASHVLRYGVYNTSERLLTQTGFFKTFLETYANEANRSKLAAVISKINASTKGTTNLTATKFEEISGVLLKYSSFTDAAVTFPCNPTTVEGAEIMTYSQSAAYTTYRKYKLQ